MRTLRKLVGIGLGGLLTLGATHVGAEPPGAHGTRPGPFGERSWHGPPTSTTAPSQRLQEFTDTRRRESAAELRALMRDADRRNEEARLAREGSPADVARLRQRIEAEDALDRLADEEALACLPPREGFERFGPVTRYLLERSRIELRWVARRRDRDLRLDALERDVAAGARTASPFETPPAPP